ncbi:transposase [Streptomyces galilaeus]|uniref:transposase n=1 Tax=Streptomyces galilaeus TaxID=33899 RepID=UPI00167C05AC
MGADTGPTPVDRRKTGSKHHLICDGHSTPLKVITTAANVNDVTQTLALVDGIPPVAGRRGWPPTSRGFAWGQGLRLQPNHDELRKRRILPVISRKGGSPPAPHPCSHGAPSRRRRTALLHG